MGNLPLIVKVSMCPELGPLETDRTQPRCDPCHSGEGFPLPNAKFRQV